LLRVTLTPVADRGKHASIPGRRAGALLARGDAEARYGWTPHRNWVTVKFDDGDVI
jgi:hypothetical protein